VRPKGSQKEVIEDIAKFIKEEHPDDSGIVYCFSRNEAETVAEELGKKGISTGVYHSTSGGKNQVHDDAVACFINALVISVIGCGVQVKSE
jgi:superfamily II DNA helicase RecQ